MERSSVVREDSELVTELTLRIDGKEVLMKIPGRHVLVGKDIHGIYVIRSEEKMIASYSFAVGFAIHQDISDRSL